MPKRKLAPLPKPFVLPDRTGISDPGVHDALKAIEKHLNMMTAYIRSSVTPKETPFPNGPWAPTASAVGSTIIISFQSDQSGPFIEAYRVYRADAGTRSSPTTPGPDSATCVATIQAIRNEDSGQYTFYDRNFTITQMDPANPARFSYWVTSIDDRDNESAFVAVANTPIETLTNGPGDQNPEPKLVMLNKFIDSHVYSALKNVEQSVAISSSTNATPIVLTVASHPFAVGDWVCVDNHATNSNANGWWKVSAQTATTITLSGSTGNGVGGASGRIYGVHKECSSGFPQVVDTTTVGTSGSGADYVNPDGSGAARAIVVPWYSNQATLVTLNGGQFSFPAPGAGATISISQEIGIRRFNPGMHLCFSVYAKTANAGANSQLKLTVTYDDGTAFVSNAWPNSVIPTGSFKRFVFNFALPTTLHSPVLRLVFTIANVNVSGTGAILTVVNPMLNVGDVAAPFTTMVDFGDYYGGSITDNDAVISPWSRSLTQALVRDSSAPYS